MFYTEILLLACFGVIGWIFANWINKARQQFQIVKASTEPLKFNAQHLYLIVRPYLIDGSVTEHFDRELLAIRSARCFGGGKYVGEFYGDFMRLYVAADENKLNEQFLIFAHLPMAVRDTHSTAELFETILSEWILEYKWQERAALINGGI